MAINGALTQRVRELFSPLPGVEEKKMFRGITFMLDGKMCVSVGDQRIMCRIGPDAYDEALRKPHCSPVIMKGKAYRGYVNVDQSGLKTKPALEYWVSLAMDFNSQARASVKKKK